MCQKFAAVLFRICFVGWLVLVSSVICNAQTEQRIKFITISPSINTGQNYTPWFDDNLNDLVPDNWNAANNQYIDVTLTLQQHSKLTKLILYDGAGVFADNPATIYAVNGTQKTLLATFTGPQYNVIDTIKLAVPAEADAIIVHKYGNNIPQKIFLYGIPVGTPATTTTTTAPTPALVKIPVDGSRWYQLNSASDGIAGMFDGDSTTAIKREYGKIFQNYDAYYPVMPGEQIDLYKVKFYSNNADLGNNPLTLSVITSDGKRVKVGTFQGGQYGTWVGPNPSKWLPGDAEFMLDLPYKNIKYLVLNCWYDFPPEIQLYGVYKAGAASTAAVKGSFPLKQYFGVNAFEWNFENPNAPDRIDTSLMSAAKPFSQVRHYLDWRHLEQSEGKFTFNASLAGGWNYDALYQGLKAKGIDVLVDIKTLPDYMLATYPDSLKDSENVPVKYGKDFSDPDSYIEQARMAYQFAARYGSNTGVDSTTINVAHISQYPGGPVNLTKKALGLVTYVECDNERDKWWKGRKAYQTAWEYAANLSAFYDGNKNTMGPGVGIKNADPNMVVVMCGLSYTSTDYIKGMVDWCRQHRGYKANGSVNLCWDVINYHYYSNNGDGSQGGTATQGAAPELAGTAATAQQFIAAAHQYAGDMPVWVTELGYDVNQGSPLKAVSIGGKTALQTQADWELRSALLYARQGVARTFFYEMYDDDLNSATEFNSSGLINSNKSRKPVADYFYQAKQLLGDYVYKNTLSTNPLVDVYQLNGKAAYILTVPDQKGRTASYSLTLNGADSVKIYKPKAGSAQMDVQYIKLTSGKLNITVTETPQFVIPLGTASANQTTSTSTPDTSSAGTGDTATGTGSTTTGTGATGTTTGSQVTDNPSATITPAFMVYPNPTVSGVSISFESKTQSQVTIRVTDASSGKVYKRVDTYANANTPFAQAVDMSSMPSGVYLIEVRQGSTVTVKKIVKMKQ